MITAKKKLLHMAELAEETRKLHEELKEWLDGMSWSPEEIYYNCTIKDGILYDSNGEELSHDGGCMDEKMPYFVNQSCGYCEDDYYGDMFYSVDDKGTFVKVSYEC